MNIRTLSAWLLSGAVVFTAVPAILASEEKKPVEEEKVRMYWTTGSLDADTVYLDKALKHCFPGREVVSGRRTPKELMDAYGITLVRVEEPTAYEIMLLSKAGLQIVVLERLHTSPEYIWMGTKENAKTRFMVSDPHFLPIDKVTFDGKRNKVLIEFAEFGSSHYDQTDVIQGSSKPASGETLFVKFHFVDEGAQTENMRRSIHKVYLFETRGPKEIKTLIEKTMNDLELPLSVRMPKLRLAEQF